jgi:hypothetical protein
MLFQVEEGHARLFQISTCQVRIGQFRPGCAFLGRVSHFYDSLGQLRSG